MRDESAAIFTKIYKDHEWGGGSRSGPGSDPHVLSDYAKVLMSIVNSRQIKTVVDIGCGDWALGRSVDWSRVDYTGVDIVPPLVAKLNTDFGGPTRRFLCADLTIDPLPSADLCVIKDVLQHLSNEKVHTFLARLPQLFKYALITNDISHEIRSSWRRRWRRTSLPPNIDVPSGGYRPLTLRAAPFCLPATQLAIIPMQFPRELHGDRCTVFETKETLLWERPTSETAS
jgi:SAM-dependent methyltransferase